LRKIEKIKEKDEYAHVNNEFMVHSKLQNSTNNIKYSFNSAL